jgi:hypothetical protein
MKHIPETLKDFFLADYPLEESELLPQGYVITRYQNTNSVVVSHIEEKRCIQWTNRLQIDNKKDMTVEYPSAESLANWKCVFPYLVAFEDSSLFVYNIERNLLEEYKSPVAENEPEDIKLRTWRKKQTIRIKSFGEHLQYVAFANADSLFVIIHQKQGNVLKVWQKTSPNTPKEAVLNGQNRLVPRSNLSYLRGTKGSFMILTFYRQFVIIR